ncbi:hypothetical protein A2V49_01300 [candidate division WWE3 bacterium RBG_19FT_COMBO_34_6]|uniref:Uncharacterized protein n=1 Tax=candidate division WWE3 bacterium RBG_19FT_COMBO_34_6 TaxID=1802612 RepID=A0A1F4UK33_UNCKA|nr:MAG: hypothetical protein A2V49_01300 [candidate division WWE3 bacterium RBG_19FT_COMBO_34_6]
MFKKIIIPVLTAFLLGLVISIATGLVLTPDKAVNLPGGSFSTGLMTGILWVYLSGLKRGGFYLILATTCAGLIGWLTYCLFV